MNKSNSLRNFLIKRFVLIIICVAVSEMLLNTLYSNVVFPIIRSELSLELSTINSGVMPALSDVLAVLFLRNMRSMLARTPIGSFFSIFNNFTDRMELMSGMNFSGGHSILDDLYYLGIMAIMLLLWLVLILPYIIAAFVFIRMIIAKVDKPIRQLTNGMNQVAEGDYRVRLDFKTEYEFARMRDTFNFMAEKVRDDELQKEEFEHKRSLLFADIAHDLKTPITTIAGYAKAMADGMVQDENKKQEYLQAVYEKSRRMDELITLLFEYSKLDSEGFELNKKNTDIAELLREITAGLYMDFEDKGIVLVIDIPDNRVSADIDRIQMSRAVANLLNNSIKHNAAGSKVYVGLFENDEALEIRIADDGAGIEGELAEHIFEPFAIGDESRNSRNGNGLGLSIASKVVNMHGGTLSLESGGNTDYTKAFVIRLQKN